MLALCAVCDAAERIESARPAMGTMFRVVIYAESSDRGSRAIDDAFQHAAQLNAILSDYIPDSELNRISTRETPVSEHLFRVLDAAQRIARATRGAFDITQGPVIRLWRDARKSGRLPDPQAIWEARARSGYRKLKLNAQRRTARLTREGMQLDLGGIAKGYAAGEMLRILREAGFASALVAAGGDIALGDPLPGRKGWAVTLGSSGAPEELANCAISTSGGESQYVVINGVRYSHIVDPRTGLGVTGMDEVTVIAKTGLQADPLATAAIVGSVKRVSKHFPDARFVTKAGRTSPQLP